MRILFLITIGGWLKIITSRHFTAEELRSGDEFSIGKMKVRTYHAVEYEPYMYSILLSHPDRDVRGRQWITEIGIKLTEQFATISILLETSDVSTLVTKIPSTTRPKLVKFLLDNTDFHHETVGLNIRKFKNEIDEFKAISYEIEREKRTYPLVLVSNSKQNNKPLVNPSTLQEQLLGLAQVIYSTDEINSWELEETLSRQYSAWDGAINIIYPSNGRDFCYTKLLTQEKIIELKESGININQYILSFITHTTNGNNKKKHFSPTDVRAKRQKDLRTTLKQRFDTLSDNNEYQILAEEAFLQLEEQEKVIEQLKEKHEREISDNLMSILELQDDLDKAKGESHVLQIRFDDLQKSSDKQGDAVLVYGKEKDFYKGEISDTLLDAIKELLKGCIKNTRRHDILTDILRYNEVDGTRESYVNILKQLFTDYSGTTHKIRSELKAMNMIIEQDGTHNHVKFIDDERYKVAFAKTPSDKRAGSNIVRDIKSNLL